MVFALLTSFFLTITGLLYPHFINAKDINALFLNWITTVISVVLFLGVILASPLPPLNFSSGDLVLIAGSSFFYYFVSDSLFFLSFKYLNPGEVLSLNTLNPVFSTLLGYLILNEVLLNRTILGVFIVIIGIIVVVSTKEKKRTHNKVSMNVGVLFMLVGTLSSGIANVILKMVSETIPDEGIAFLRLAFAFFMLMLLMLFRGRSYFKSNFQKIKTVKVSLVLILVAFFGTFGAGWLMTIAVRQIPIGVAVALGSLAPVFVVILTLKKSDGLFKKASSVLSAVLVVLGVYLIANG